MSTWNEYRDISVEYRGKTYYVSVLVTISKFIYGADIDGNRGVPQEALDDYSIEIVYDLESGREIRGLERDWKFLGVVREKLFN